MPRSETHPHTAYKSHSLTSYLGITMSRHRRSRLPDFSFDDGRQPQDETEQAGSVNSSLSRPRPKLRTSGSTSTGAEGETTGPKIKREGSAPGKPPVKVSQLTSGTTSGESGGDGTSQGRKKRQGSNEQLIYICGGVGISVVLLGVLLFAASGDSGNSSRHRQRSQPRYSGEFGRGVERRRKFASRGRSLADLLEEDGSQESDSQ